MDYKKLYEEQLKENEKLKAQCECDDDGYAISDWFNEKMKKHIECHLSGDGEWGSLGFKNLQEFVDAYDKLEEQTTEKKILWNKYDTFCKLMCEYDPQYSMDDELNFLKDETEDQQLIKEVFDEKYEGEHYYDIETKDYKNYDEDESDEE